jgi:hypothetical protein
MNTIRRFAAAAGLALTAAAVTEQLRQPIGRRTWEGAILGVPYDFRPVTMDRVRERMWNPANPSLFAPQVYGVGWTINLYRVLHPGG